MFMKQLDYVEHDMVIFYYSIKILKLLILITTSNFVLFVVFFKTISLCEVLHHQNLIKIMPIYVAQPLSNTYFSFYFVLCFKYGLMSLHVLGHISYHILAAGLDGYMEIVANLKNSVKKWLYGDVQLLYDFRYLNSLHSFQI